MHAILSVDRGADVGRSIVLEPGRVYVIGRSSRADFSFRGTDSHMSRSHFHVELVPPRFLLRDLGSENGCYVNNERVVETVLKDGDRIKAGKTRLRVAILDGDADLATRHQLSVLDPSAAGEGDPSWNGTTLGDASVVVCRGCGRGFVETDETPARPTLCAVCLDDSADLEQGLADYTIVRELGRGGMGIVSLAVRKSDGVRFAVKSIPGQNDEVQSRREARLRREAEILHDLIHPHIVGFHELGERAGQYVFVMEYVEGRDAAQLLKAEGPFAISRVIRLAGQLLEALDYAHAKGFVHCDIKPGNLLVTVDRGVESVKLADFGLARILDPSNGTGTSTKSGLAGTPGFIAPEQILGAGRAIPATDQYAVAATLYYLLTGQFTHDFEQNVFLAILEDSHTPIRSRRPGIPDGLAEIIDRGLQRDPAARYPSVIEMRRALARLSQRL